MELLISKQWAPEKRLPIPRKRLLALLSALLDSEGRNPEVELSLVFSDDAFIHQLNRDYRGKDKPTDVLSFEQDPESGLLGDLVISIPTSQRQAQERGHALAQEVEWLFLHGALHLLGYDDETDEQAEEMNRRAQAALDLLAATKPADLAAGRN
jgi:probable rRNA maturation factor